MAASREKAKGATPLALTAFSRTWFHSSTTSADRTQRSSSGSTDSLGRPRPQRGARGARRVGETAFQQSSQGWDNIVALLLEAGLRCHDGDISPGAQTERRGGAVQDGLEIRPTERAGGGL